MSSSNEWGQPIGPALPDWSSPPLPPSCVLEGRFVRLEPLEPRRHAQHLFQATAGDEAAWTYLPYGPFHAPDTFCAWLSECARLDDPKFFALVDPANSVARGLAAYLRIAPASGSIEVGHLNYGRDLRRTPAATEAMYLMMRMAFALGYRRYEWKCDAFNHPSRQAALRLGFTYEGTFRNATVYKGRSRDTAWYSVVESEWPVLERGFCRWLAPENFTADGRQKKTLAELRLG